MSNSALGKCYEKFAHTSMTTEAQGLVSTSNLNTPDFNVFLLRILFFLKLHAIKCKGSVCLTQESL